MLAYTVNYIASGDQEKSELFSKHRKCLLYSVLVHGLKMNDAMEIFQMLEMSKKL